MFRSLISLIVVASLTSPVAAKKVSIKWHGQSFFEITSSEGTIVAIESLWCQSRRASRRKPDV